MHTQNRSNLKTQGGAYREFSRRRYKELKAQSPNLRESEIVARVIREWDAMNSEQRGKFLNPKDDTLVMLNVQPLSTPQKGETGMMKGKTNQKTTIQKRVQKMERMQGSSSSLMEEINVREFEESSADKGMKTKKIAHARNKNSDQYIRFFKSYFDRLLKEHPRWSARQITSIIKLLWRKRKQSASKTKAMRQGKTKLARPLSGRVFFRRNKLLTSNEAKDKWKRLPYESKRMWYLMSNPADEMKGGSMTMTLRLAQGMPMQMNKLNFINMRMI